MSSTLSALHRLLSYSTSSSFIQQLSSVMPKCCAETFFKLTFSRPSKQSTWNQLPGRSKSVTHMKSIKACAKHTYIWAEHTAQLSHTFARKSAGKGWGGCNFLPSRNTFPLCQTGRAHGRAKMKLICSSNAAYFSHKNPTTSPSTPVQPALPRQCALPALQFISILLNVVETILFHCFTLAVRDLQQTAAAAAPLNELSNLATPRHCNHLGRHRLARLQPIRFARRSPLGEGRKTLQIS